MDIEGPVQIKIGEPADGQGRLLLLSFRPDFVAKPPPERAAAFAGYLQELTRGVADPNLDEANRQGMLIVQQVAEQLLPHLQADDLDLEQEMIIQIRPQEAAAISDLLTLNLLG